MSQEADRRTFGVHLRRVHRPLHDIIRDESTGEPTAASGKSDLPAPQEICGILIST